MTHVIDTNEPTLAQALDEWADALKRFAEQADALNTDLRAEFDLDVADEPVPFELVPVGSEVRLAGEWQRVLAKVTDNLGASAGHALVLSEGGKPLWLYHAAGGETFTVRGPF